MRTTTWCVLAAIGLIAGMQNQADAGFITVTTDTSWRAIAPEGNREGTPIDSVGLAWELLNVGWNTNLHYDDSNSAGWHSSVLLDVLPRYPYIWGDGNSYEGSTPTYFRKEFEIEGNPTLGVLDFQVDDDALIYINGVLVVNDKNSFATQQTGIDITPYLTAGTNLIAVKAHDSYPGPFPSDPRNYEGLGIAMDIQFTAVPCPSAIVMLGMGAWTIGAWAGASRFLRNRITTGAL